MEFMNMLNSKGPRMEPWGTPDVTGAKSEAIPSRTTLCFHQSSKIVFEPVQEGPRDTNVGQG